MDWDRDWEREGSGVVAGEEDILSVGFQRMVVLREVCYKPFWKRSRPRIRYQFRGCSELLRCNTERGQLRLSVKAKEAGRQM
jgi:hypothetical protein